MCHDRVGHMHGSTPRGSIRSKTCHRVYHIQDAARGTQQEAIGFRSKRVGRFEVRATWPAGLPPNESRRLAGVRTALAKSPRMASTRCSRVRVRLMRPQLYLKLRRKGL